MSIAVIAAVLQARIVVNTAPAVISALLVPLAAAVVACAETGAVARVRVAALVRDVADLVGAALAAAGSTAGLVLDGSGGAAAGLQSGKVSEGREGRREGRESVRGRRACRSQRQRWSGRRSMRPGGQLRMCSAVSWLEYGLRGG